MPPSDFLSISLFATPAKSRPVANFLWVFIFKFLRNGFFVDFCVQDESFQFSPGITRYGKFAPGQCEAAF